MQIAKRVQGVQRSPILEMAAMAASLRAEGQKIIDLSIGVPNYLPGPHVYQAAHQALDLDSGKYGQPRGHDELMIAFSESLKEIGLDWFTVENCIAGMGAKNILYNLMQVLMDPGDTILIPAPYWTSYSSIAAAAGTNIKILPCDPDNNYKVRPEELDRALDGGVKSFLFNNPVNPTGVVYHAEEIDQLSQILERHDNVWIIADDIYHRLIFDDIGYHNFGQFSSKIRDRLIFVDSLSKTYGMPGWRIGFAAAPPNVAEALVSLNSNQITSLPEVVSHAGIAALNGPQDTVIDARKQLQSRRDLIVAHFDRNPLIRYAKPEGAFYVFPDISQHFGKQNNGRRIENSVDFCQALLLEKGVACVPGVAFGDDRGMRISYSCDEKELDDGLGKISEFIESL